jgi:GTP-binding protein EngB required for normal cell division
VSLLDDLRRLFADAEVSLVGARDERNEAERALEAGDWFKARSAARRILDRAPRSPIGFALLADACEGAGLDAELEEALATLARMAGASPQVWLRLGHVRKRVGASTREIREAYTRAVAWDDDADLERRAAARAARIGLADLELAEGSPARAEGWLAPIDDEGSDLVRRRLACAIARGARDEVTRLAVGFAPEVSDAEGQRLLGTAKLMLGDPSTAVRALARATMLDDPLAPAALRDAIARSRGLDEGALKAAEAVADARGLLAEPLWRAAFSAARGDASTAASALRDALASGAHLQGPADRAAARALAVAARDLRLLHAVSEQGEPAGGMDAALASAATAAEDSDSAAIERGLDALLHGGTERGDPAREGWAADLSRRLLARLLPDDGTAAWDRITERIAAHARALGDFDALRRLEHLAAERARGVRIAIVGEFNAGKSTFVNALLGMDVAPTGILPTTAVAHTLRYGPDPIARARLRGGGARTVPPERLKALLAELGKDAVAEVEVEVPFPYLQRVELVDTPGFNAPDPEHTKTAMATLIEGAGVDVAIWLFDVGQPLKTSERRILEAIVSRGIPMQALLNKSDRLSAEDLAHVMRTFEEDARSIGLQSWRPPLAFSARRAVEGRIQGDEAALAQSGFGPVRALLEDELPSHAAELKERGLRRRAHDIAVLLAESASRARNESVVKSSARSAEDARWVAQAILLERAAALDVGGLERTSRDESADLARRAVRDELRTAIDAFRRERDELLAKDDPTMLGYLDRRLAEHLEPAVARAMAAALSRTAPDPASSQTLDDLWLDAAALARGFAAAGADTVESLPTSTEGVRAGKRRRPDVEGGLVRALLGILAARLRAKAVRPGHEPDPVSARARELGALVVLLAPPPIAGAQHIQNAEQGA